jgi:periplasmic copper chaperone A
MPQAGCTIGATRQPLAQPYESHGEHLDEDLRAIILIDTSTWSCTMHRSLLSFVAAAALAVSTFAAHAQVSVQAPWARPTVPGQQGGGGFLSLTSAAGDRLVGGSTPLAERFELHTMAMKGDVMEMRQVDAIELPAGKTVELKPGGLHVMFIGLKQPLALGSKVPVTLKFEKAGEVKVEFEVMSRPAAAGHGNHKP